MPRRTSRVYSSLDGLRARNGRAAEDTYAMTSDAKLGRLAKIVVEVHLENPNLDERQLRNAARLRLRTQMAELAAKSAEARRAASPAGA